jgi:hypothetical protein
MKAHLCLPVWWLSLVVAVVGPIAATSYAAGNGSRQPTEAALAAREPNTFIYVHDRRVGYVDPSWTASWGQSIFAEVYKSDNRTFIADCENSHYPYGYAKRQTRTHWVMATLPPPSTQIGSAWFLSHNRWNVYNRQGALVASTRGPHGVVAALAWLTLRPCHD